MVNFFDINIERVAVNKILPKTKHTEAGQVIYIQQLVDLSPATVQMVQDRLYDAALSSKYFQLGIEDDSDSGFFGHAKDLHASDDNKFIEYSGAIAELLADTMVTGTIPGGYLLVVQARTDRTDKKVIVVIKADVHDVVTLNGNAINIIEEVFLSPSKKFLKFGLLFEYNTPQKEDFSGFAFPNNEWGAFVFDQQFRVDSKLAEYFYRDFLGFTTKYNAKIQSANFYNETENFIMKNVLGLNDKVDLLNLLDFEFTQNISEADISPREFADKYIHDEALNEDYKDEIAEYLPGIIEKNASLFKNRLFNKKISFRNNIKLTGSKDAIDANVQIITNQEELKELPEALGDNTILLIKGKPFGG